MVEAVVRLLPGFMGNAESLTEESHTAGLLEYPVFTKPAPGGATRSPRCCCRATTPGSPRGATSSPYAAPSSAVRTSPTPRPLGPATWRACCVAVPADAGELLTLQRACWVQEQLANPGVRIPALHEDLDDVLAWLGEWTTLVLRSGGRLVAAVRGRRRGRRPGTSAG